MERVFGHISGKVKVIHDFNDYCRWRSALSRVASFSESKSRGSNSETGWIGQVLASTELLNSNNKKEG
ncbi:MAG: hypothetical protein MP439_05620 [Ferrimicrobium sp.]|jgi:hypothetical protein|nr:hypothetical protein [Ferrimicrobium sp.]